MSGYHINKITKGILGETSKIQEELDEVIDAEQQGNRIMVGVELSDLYGAIEIYADKFGLTMEDLRIMSEATRRAFQSGQRTSTDQPEMILLTEEFVKSEEFIKSADPIEEHEYYDYSTTFEGKLNVYLNNRVDGGHLIDVNVDEDVTIRIDSNFIMNMSDNAIEVTYTEDGEVHQVHIQPNDFIHYKKVHPFNLKVWAGRQYYIYSGSDHLGKDVNEPSYKHLRLDSNICKFLALGISIRDHQEEISFSG